MELLLGFAGHLTHIDWFLRVNQTSLQTVDGTGTVGGEFTLVSGSDASTPLAFDASAAEVSEAVNSMKEWSGLVLVERQELGYNESSDSGDVPEGDMFEWRLTFPPAEGDTQELRVRGPCISAPKAKVE